MKFFTATLGTESNSYAAAPTGYAAFESFGIHHGDGSRQAKDCGRGHRTQVRRVRA